MFLFTRSHRFTDPKCRENARNFLVIPKTKKLFLIFTDNMTSDDVILLCRSIRDNSTRSYYVFVVSSRESEMPSLIKKEFGDDAPIKSVTVSKRIGIFLQAADVTISYGKNMYEQIMKSTKNISYFLSDSIQGIVNKIKPNKRGV
jgi:hypothetical protein